MESAGGTIFVRYDWNVADVEKLGARLDQVVRQQVGTRPAGLDPSKPVDWAKEEERTWREWRQARADVMRSRIDDKYQDAKTRHEYSQKWLKAYRDGRCVNMLIHGPTGCGKTWELSAIALELLGVDLVPALLVKVPVLIERLTSVPRREVDAELSTFASAPVLGLDDLGAEKANEWRDVLLYRLSDYRNAHNLPTLVTSNLPPEELAKRYDSRVFRRLFEGAARLHIPARPPEVPQAFGAVL